MLHSIPLEMVPGQNLSGNTFHLPVRETFLLLSPLEREGEEREREQGREGERKRGRESRKGEVGREREEGGRRVEEVSTAQDNSVLVWGCCLQPTPLCTCSASVSKRTLPQNLSLHLKRERETGRLAQTDRQTDSHCADPHLPRPFPDPT